MTEGHVEQDWNMAENYFISIAKIIDMCDDAAYRANEDATYYDEWYRCLLILTMRIRPMCNKEDSKQRITDMHNQVRDIMGFNISYTFNLNLESSPKKRAEIDAALLTLQEELINQAYLNGLVVRRREYGDDYLYSGV